jgi:hypothetical protein
MELRTKLLVLAIAIGLPAVLIALAYGRERVERSVSLRRVPRREGTHRLTPGIPSPQRLAELRGDGDGGIPSLAERLALYEELMGLGPVSPAILEGMGGPLTSEMENAARRLAEPLRRLEEALRAAGPAGGGSDPEEAARLLEALSAEILAAAPAGPRGKSPGPEPREARAQREALAALLRGLLASRAAAAPVEEGGAPAAANEEEAKGAGSEAAEKAATEAEKAGEAQRRSSAPVDHQ